MSSKIRRSKSTKKVSSKTRSSSKSSSKTRSPSKSSKARRRAAGWPEALTRYEAHLLAERKGELTVYAYLLEAQRLREHLARQGVDTPDDVTLEHLRAYQVGLLTGACTRTGRPSSVRTVHRITTTLGGLFAFLTAEGLVARDPSLRLERPRLPRSLPGDVLTTREVRRLLRVPDTSTPEGLRDRALLEVFYGAGLRRAEVLGLDLADLDHRERELRVRGKGNKERLVPLTRSAWLELVAYLERGRPALCSRHPDSGRAVFLSSHGRRCCELTPMRLLRRCALAAGLDRRVTPHTLRRTYATELLKAGVSLRHIQLLLGHEKLSTTALYLRLDTRDLRRELLLKHPRERIDA